MRFYRLPVERDGDFPQGDAMFIWSVSIALTLVLGLGIGLCGAFGGDWVDGLDEQIGDIMAAQARQLQPFSSSGESIRRYAKAISLHFNEPIQRARAMEDLALLYLANEDPANAAELMQEVVSNHPSELKSYRILGSALRALGRKDEALVVEEKRLAEAKAQNNEHVTFLAYNECGYLHLDAGRKEEALNCFREGQAISPDPRIAELIEKIDQ